MAVAASIDVTLTAKTEKFAKDMKKGEAAMSHFSRFSRSVSSGLGDIGKRFQQFSPANIIASFIAFESIKKVVEEIKKLMGTGFFDASTESALESIGKSWTDIKNQALSVVASLAAAFAPAITLVLSGWAEIFRVIAEYVGEVTSQIRQWQGAPEIVGLSDAAQSRVRSGELGRWMEEQKKKTEDARGRAEQLKEQFKPLQQKIQERMKEIQDLFQGGFIDQSTYAAAMADLQKEWQDFIDEGKKATEQYNKEQMELARKSHEEKIRQEKERQEAFQKALEAAKKAEEERLESQSKAFQENVMDPLRERASKIDQMVATDQAPSAVSAGSVDFASQYLQIQRDNENRDWKAKQLAYLQRIANELARRAGVPIAEAAI